MADWWDGDPGGWLDPDGDSLDYLDLRWGEPIPLGPPAPDPLTVDVLPPVLRDHVRSVAASVQVPADLPAVLSLCAVSAAVAGKVEVEVDGAWRAEWVALYGAAVLRVGERKSAGFEPIVAPMRGWEAERAGESAPRVRTALDVVEVRERELQAAKKDAAAGGPLEAVEAARLALDRAREAVPTVPELLASDSTPEALVRQMAEQGGRVAVFSPEGGPLQVLAGRYSEGAARLEEVAQAYDGEEILSRRIGRETVRVPRPALTLGLCIQPSVLETIRNARSLRGQGIWGRISWVLPPSLMGRRRDSSEVPPLDREAAARYEAALRMLLDWRATSGEDGTPVPHRLRLSEEATATKRAYHYEVEGGLRQGGEYAGIRDWAGKTVGRAVRIAALLELAARAADARPLVGEPISGWAMEGAVRICRALTTHALAVYGEMEADSDLRLARYLVDRIGDLVERREGPPSKSDLLQVVKQKRGLETAAKLDRLLGFLEARNLVRIVDRPSEGPGRPESPLVLPHPNAAPGVQNIQETRETDRERATGADSLDFLDAKPGEGDETGRSLYRTPEEIEAELDAALGGGGA